MRDGNRVKTTRPLTPKQEHIVVLLDQGFTYPEIGEQLGIHSRSVKGHVERIARVIPGLLPARAKVVAWWRGAPAETLV